MKTMQVNLDKFELVNLLESCARGSHLRQHIWRRLVVEWLKQMNDAQMDFTWWVLWRDVWPLYFQGESIKCGARDFLQAMAALNRNNYRDVHALIDDKGEDFTCYEFEGKYYLAGTFDRCLKDEEVCIVRFPNKKKGENIPSEFLLHWRLTSIYSEPISNLMNVPQNKLIDL